MKLWLVSQSERNGYDTFDSMIVAAQTEQEARKMHPTEAWGLKVNNWEHTASWASSPDAVKVDILGEAKPDLESGVILASFNAG